MSSQQKHRIQVPDGLRDVLLEFSIAYLLEQPGDVIDYAVEFFSKLQENRKTTMITAAEPISPDESIMSHEEEPLVNRYASRRKSVFAETYDPENDDDDDGDEPGIPSKCWSLASVDYVPALCTHRPSLLPMDYLVRSLKVNIC